MHEELKTRKNYFSEDARITKFHFQKFCLSELCCALFSAIGIALAIVAVKNSIYFNFFLFYC